MKIESVDTVNLGYSGASNTADDKPKSRQVENTELNGPALQNKNLTNLTEFQKNELPVADKVVIEAIEKANKAISGYNKKFEFSIHEKTKQIMVKVLDADTDEVIREIPPEKILDMVAKLVEMAGIMVDKKG